MIALQLDGITENTREALELAALVGQEFELELLREILGNDQALDDLFANPILLRKDDRTGLFTHSLVREVIRQDILWSKRKRLNLNIAVALEAREAPPEQVGQYWLEGGDKVRARLAFTEASRLYCRLHAHADAARTAHLALEIWPKGTDEDLRLEILHQFAGCTRVSGQVHNSILALREILESPLIRENYRKLGETYRALAISYALQGTWRHYKECRRQAAEWHEKAGLWAEATLDWHELANCCIDEYDIHSALESASRAIHCARQTQKADLLSKVMSVKGYVLAIQGKGEEGTGMVREAIALALSHNHIEASAYAYRKLASALEYTSDFNASVRAYESALNYCRQENLDQQIQFCMTCMSWVLFRTGDWKRSLEVCREYLESPTVNDSSRALGHLVIGLIRLLRGETKTAGHYLQDAYTLIMQANFHLLDPLLHWAMGMLHESENQPDKAHHSYCQLLNYWDKSGDVHDILPGLCSAISFFANHDYREECNQTVQVLSSIANQTGNAEAVGSLSFALGEMASYGRQYGEAVVHYTHAIRAFDELSVTQQLIMALCRKSTAHLAAGEKPEAAEGLSQALQLAKPLGARPLIATLTALLEQATEKAGSTRHAPFAAPTPLAGLTGRQSEILGALVAGLSNKEIGVKLHLSTRTVDMHVRHIFDRLNCRTRAEAVRVAIEKKIVQSVE
jgi:DNA-binding CsgD family transcriptional regulator